MTDYVIEIVTTISEVLASRVADHPMVRRCYAYEPKRNFLTYMGTLGISGNSAIKALDRTSFD